MGYRTSTDVYFLDAPPEKVWTLVADPTVIEELVAHGVTFEPELQGPVSTGDTWVEVHGPECDDDRVPWEVVEARAPEVVRLHGWQSGMRQESTFELTPHDGGTILRTRLTLTPTLRGRSKAATADVAPVRGRDARVDGRARARPGEAEPAGTTACGGRALVVIGRHAIYICPWRSG